MNPRIVTQSLSGNSLAAAAMSGSAPANWYLPVPADAASWRERLDSVRSDSADDWLARLAPAFDATGKAKERLQRSSARRGVIITTGQQPGLFGGPIYTLSKALSALALADALQNMTGIPVAPVFWAATDDSDFREASSIGVSVPGGARELVMEPAAPIGVPMSKMPLGDLAPLIAEMVAASGSGVYRNAVARLSEFY